MRPIKHGYYRLQDLYNGSLDLEMVARANDTIDMETENEIRFSISRAKAKP